MAFILNGLRAIDKICEAFLSTFATPYSLWDHSMWRLSLPIENYATQGQLPSTTTTTILIYSNSRVCWNSLYLFVFQVMLFTLTTFLFKWRRVLDSAEPSGSSVINDFTLHARFTIIIWLFVVFNVEWWFATLQKFLQLFSSTLSCLILASLSHHSASDTNVTYMVTRGEWSNSHLQPQSVTY